MKKQIIDAIFEIGHCILDMAKDATLNKLTAVKQPDIEYTSINDYTEEMKDVVGDAVADDFPSTEQIQEMMEEALNPTVEQPKKKRVMTDEHKQKIAEARKATHKVKEEPAAAAATTMFSVVQQEVKEEPKKKNGNGPKIPIEHQLLLDAFRGAPKQIAEVRTLAQNAYANAGLDNFEGSWATFVARGLEYFTLYSWEVKKVNRNGSEYDEEKKGPLYFVAKPLNK